MEATRTTSVTSASAPNEQMIYNMDPAYQVGYTQQEVDGKNSENITYSKQCWVPIEDLIIQALSGVPFYS